MSNVRKNPTENWQLILFEEVGGVCPKCNKELVYQKASNTNLYKGYEAAHIYPLNPTSEEKGALKDEEQLSADPNDIKNFILLCKSCHGKFDKPRTVEEYRELLKLKKEYLEKAKAKSLWHSNQLQEEVKAIIIQLSDIDFSETKGELNYSPVEIVEKFDHTISTITKNKVKNNIRDYFYEVRDLLVMFEKLSPETSSLISLQIRTFYTKLKKEGYDQQGIYEAIVEWVDAQTQSASRDSCEAFVSFFIQNCEVYE